jgi:DNA-binding SARP family transcriptional activator/predicted ATPase
MGERSGPGLHLRLLGVPEIALVGRPVRLRRRSAVALLAYLAVTGRPHSREALAALVSGDDAGAGPAERRLSNALAELRVALGGPAGYLLADRETVALDTSRPLRLDVTALQGAAAAARSGDPGAARTAGELYRDELLAGFALPDAPAFDEWLLLQREHLLATLTQALQAGLDRLVRRGATADAADATAVARRLLALEPWREEAHRALMVLLARAGQRAAALAQYEACRRALAAELGVPPAAETRALRDRLVAGPVPVPSNLPAPLDETIGREAELARLADLLADPARRLVTLVGLGGSGKTRLAVEAAGRLVAPGGAALEPLFPDGVCLVSLDGPGAVDVPRGSGEGPAVGPAAGLLAAVEDALARVVAPPDPRVAASGAGPAALCECLRARRLLLILDGLHDAATAASAAPLVVAWLRQAPGLKVLATGRVRLLAEGEAVLEVRGLPLPAGPDDLAASPAGALFLREAARARWEAPLDAAGRAAAAAVCRAVDGLPLALELAAGCLRGMTCADLAAELSRGASGLDLLAAETVGRPARLHRMRAVLDDAWAGLPEAERDALRGLSDFDADFTQASASAVAGVTAPQLLALTEAAVVVRLCGAGAHGDGAAGRYALPALVRAYAAERLAERAPEAHRVRTRHGDLGAATSGRFLPAVDAAGAGVPGRPPLGARPEAPRPPHASWWPPGGGLSAPPGRLDVAIAGYLAERAALREQRVHREQPWAAGPCAGPPVGLPSAARSPPPPAETTPTPGGSLTLTGSGLVIDSLTGRRL